MLASLLFVLGATHAVGMNAVKSKAMLNIAPRAHSVRLDSSMLESFVHSLLASAYGAAWRLHLKVYGAPIAVEKQVWKASVLKVRAVQFDGHAAWYSVQVVFDRAY